MVERWQERQATRHDQESPTATDQGASFGPRRRYCVKSATDGNKKYVWGYKVHILADTRYELPLAINVRQEMSTT
jgi:hypothetical protein